eukprot:jgi/Botrbrau1/7214/Bobra.0300s0039.1
MRRRGGWQQVNRVRGGGGIRRGGGESGVIHGVWGFRCGVVGIQECGDSVVGGEEGFRLVGDRWELRTGLGLLGVIEEWCGIRVWWDLRREGWCIRAGVVGIEEGGSGGEVVGLQEGVGIGCVWRDWVGRVVGFEVGWWGLKKKEVVGRDSGGVGIEEGGWDQECCVGRWGLWWGGEEDGASGIKRGVIQVVVVGVSGVGGDSGGVVGIQVQTVKVGGGGESGGDESGGVVGGGFRAVVGSGGVWDSVVVCGDSGGWWGFRAGVVDSGGGGGDSGGGGGIRGGWWDSAVVGMWAPQPSFRVDNGLLESPRYYRLILLLRVSPGNALQVGEPRRDMGLTRFTAAFGTFEGKSNYLKSQSLLMS